MFVANRMTKNPITVSPDTKVDEAAALMKKHHFRRLPVVTDGKLVGFLSDKDIIKAAPSPATTLAKYEINSLLAKMRIADIMAKEVISVQVDATIEEAALLMCNHKIGGLPVISSVGSVVGVITETDIFKTFVDVMGLAEGKTRLTLEVQDRVGTVKEIASVFSDLGISIDSLITCKKDDGSYEIVVRGDFTDLNKIKESLEEKGFTIAHMVQIGQDK
jgi:acetoin utilization protein AcuB